MEENRVIGRGDVYWMMFGEEGSIMQAHRPVLVVSSDKGNETAPWVMFVPMSTKPKYGVINPKITSVGKPSWVKCSQVQSVDKDRLGIYMGTVSEEEMAAVDRGLKICLSLQGSSGEDDEDRDEEVRSLEEEIAQLKTQLSRREDSDTSVVVERDMWHRMYDKAMEMLVSAQMSAKWSEAPEVEEVSVVEEPVVEEPEVEEIEVEEPKVEINTCTAEDLRSCGCSLTMIKYIIANRPYKSVEDLKAIPQLTRMGYQILASKICCVPPAKANRNVAPRTTPKVNVNTATVAEMMAVGLPKGLSEHIRAYRNKNGKFKTLNDLLNVDIFGKVCMSRYGDRLEV